MVSIFAKEGKKSGGFCICDDGRVADTGVQELIQGPRNVGNDSSLMLKPRCLCVHIKYIPHSSFILKLQILTDC